MRQDRLVLDQHHQIDRVIIDGKRQIGHHLGVETLGLGRQHHADPGLFGADGDQAGTRAGRSGRRHPGIQQKDAEARAGRPVSARRADRAGADHRHVGRVFVHSRSLLRYSGSRRGHTWC
ncbi:MAG: hypothetical protein O3A88_03785 [Proteobacteria bacterium]|nr:hypothetical protein [Pseudomonadota bacterium]